MRETPAASGRLVSVFKLRAGGAGEGRSSRPSSRLHIRNLRETTSTRSVSPVPPCQRRAARCPATKHRHKQSSPSGIHLIRMHIKTGTWEASNAVCESDPLCDPAVLVAAPKPEPHIRNRRLSPGSGSCGGGGGGGGGGCTAGVDSKSIRQTSSNSFNESHRTGHTHVFFSSLHREQRVHARGNRGSRQDGGGMGPRGGEKNLRSSQTHTHKERWVGDTLSSLKPPPAFPVKDSPAKLQPAVSYASKVKAGGTSGGVAEEPPGIKVLLQNQWGLSFISDGPAVENAASVPPKDMSARSPAATPHPVAGEETAENSVSSTSTSSQSQCTKEPKNSEELLLSCHHLVEAVEYHTQEWNAILRGQKQDPAKVAWYKDDL